MPKNKNQHKKAVRYLHQVKDDLPTPATMHTLTWLAQWCYGINRVAGIAEQLGWNHSGSLEQFLRSFFRDLPILDLPLRRGAGIRGPVRTPPVCAPKVRPLKRGKSFYESPRWRTLRFMIIECYGRECMACGRVEGEMHVDHIEPRSKAPDRELDPWNLQVLCKDCNLGKVNFSDRDYRSAAHKVTLSLSYASIIENMDAAARLMR